MMYAEMVFDQRENLNSHLLICLVVRGLSFLDMADRHLTNMALVQTVDNHVARCKEEDKTVLVVHHSHNLASKACELIGPDTVVVLWDAIL